MLHKILSNTISISLLFILLCSTTQAQEDPYLWLEEIQGKKALDQVRSWNKKTLSELQSDARYQDLYQEALGILTNKARIPLGSIHGENIYNFWQDDDHVRGIWRRTSLASYLSDTPQWETLLDIDALEEKEHQNWIHKGENLLPGENRCMVSVSRGGSDASVLREFSITEKKFVEDGFIVPEAKSRMAWLHQDALLIGTDWGKGSLTESGYPRIMKIWKRGTPLHQAETIFEGKPEDVSVNAFTTHHGGSDYTFISRGVTFFESEIYYLKNNKNPVKLPIPLKKRLSGVQDGRAIVSLNEDWQYQGMHFSQGSVIALDLKSMEAELVFQPKGGQAVSRVAVGRTVLFVQLLDNIVGKVKRLSREDNGKWISQEVPLPDNGVVSIASSDSDRDDLIVSFESLTVADSLYYVSRSNKTKPIMSLPEMYDAEGVVVEQRFARSKDGTKVPYFIMGRRDVLAAGEAPTIQYGYGGFAIPILPNYYQDPSRPQHGALAGKLWISRGGLLVLSNIRGGGEFGPSWHQAALKENRQRAYDDFFAIGEDLVTSRVTTPKKLGAIGRSNGGLLMGVVLTQRPDLYAAVDCGVPLFDMMRYDKLLAGASWVGEFGDPDIPEEREYLIKYSPYQNLKPGKKYPKVLFYTSTKDDRVHPGHARKAAARLKEYGYDFYYYENLEGGHGGTANQEQLAMRTALEYIYFIRQLMDD